MNLFSYGTLQFPEVMSVLLQETFTFEDIEIDGFKCRKLKGEVFPGAIPDEHEKIVGRLYFGLSNQHQIIIDEFESDYYSSNETIVNSSTRGEVPAVIYILRNEFYSLMETTFWDKDQFQRDLLKKYLEDII